MRQSLKLFAASVATLACSLLATQSAIAQENFSPNEDFVVSKQTSQEKVESNDSLSVSDREEKLKEIQQEYATFDLEEKIAEDPVGYKQRLNLIDSSPGLVVYFEKYSVSPLEDKQRMAASTPTIVVEEIVRNLKNKALLINPNSGAVELVPEEDGDKYDHEEQKFSALSNAPCWKSYVGAGTAAILTSFYCGLGGPIVSAGCILAFGLGGLHVDWNVNC